jgi:hypothetical protein
MPLASPPPLSPGEFVRKAYLWSLFSLLILGGATFILGTFHKAYYPFGWDDDEGAVWWEAAHVTNLRVMYHPIQEYPYFVVPYPPVFHAVAHIAAEAVGDYLVGGRLVCVFSALGIALLFALIVFQALPRRIPGRIRGSGALVAALLCFRLDSLNRYIPEMGVDLLALFLAFLGIFMFLRAAEQGRAQYAAFACFVLAVFTKQTMIAAPIACLAARALINPRKALRYLAFCVALGLGSLACLAWATQGEILRHLFLYNAQQPFAITQWILGMQENVIGMTPILAVGALAILAVVRHSFLTKLRNFVSWLRVGLRTSAYRRTVFVLGMQLLIALVISLTYGKAGSGVHYFLEWNLICCALAGMVFAQALAHWNPGKRFAAGSTVVFVLIFLAALTGFPDSLRRINSVFRVTSGERLTQDAKYSSSAAVLKILEETPGPVFCENMVLTMKAHKEIPIEPGIQCFLAKRGTWDQSGFVNLISSRQFGVIVLRDIHNEFWTRAMVDAIELNYVPSEEIGDERFAGCHYTVYRPRRS